VQIMSRNELPAETLTLPDGGRIAYRRLAARSGDGRPGIVFLSGFASDMTGTKGTALAAWAEARGQSLLRFDYSGHGQSSGVFRDGTIGRWTDDALAAIDRLTAGPQILVGSSMGGWIMLLAALARPDRIAGLVGIAAAPDFTEDLMWAEIPAETRARLLADGAIEQPSQYQGRAAGNPPRADRRRPPPSRAAWVHRYPLPGAPAARHGRSRRALADEPATDGTPRRR
jgi:pimeloyl-ACP methyl ester carboxylesterase